MAFYNTLLTLDLKPLSEVVLCGSNCAVMIDAVIKAGLVPVLSDISVSNLASRLDNIEAVITPKTSVIVVQHTFGIINDVILDLKIFRDRGIFIIEDCALTLGSTLNGLEAGSKGDAAIYSFDSTKPVNGYVGGCVVTKNSYLSEQLSIKLANSSSFSSKQGKIFLELNKAALFSGGIANGGNRILKSLPWQILAKVGGLSTGLAEDARVSGHHNKYPYPAKALAFSLHQVSFQLKNYAEISKKRRQFSKRLLSLVLDYRDLVEVPSDFISNHASMTPLRFPLIFRDGEMKDNFQSRNIDKDRAWFSPPIIGYNGSKKFLDQLSKNCVNAKTVSAAIVNVPCCAPRKYDDLILQDVRESLNLLRKFKRNLSCD